MSEKQLTPTEALDKAIKAIDLRFRSGNSVAVDPCRIPALEWFQLLQAIAAFRAEEPSALINRRADIEQYLLDCSRGKRPLPDGGTCRKLALRLGTPKEQWSEVPKEDLP